MLTSIATDCLTSLCWDGNCLNVVNICSSHIACLTRIMILENNLDKNRLEMNEAASPQECNVSMLSMVLRHEYEVMTLVWKDIRIKT